MKTSESALVLIGFQNDYFSSDGILHAVVEKTIKSGDILNNTLHLIETLKDTDLKIYSTPIEFSDDYVELIEPVGILQTVKDVGAFKKGHPGAEVIPEIQAYGDRIKTVPGKRGLNAFSNTHLGKELEQEGIRNVILAGVVTSVCIDSTGRHASDQGYAVYILEDCTSGRSMEEQEFYCNNIFPIYSKVLSSSDLLKNIEEEAKI